MTRPNHRPRLFTLAVGLAAAFAGGSVARAAVFTDPGAFASQIQPGFYLEDFEAFSTPPAIPNPLLLSEGGYSYSISTPGSFFLSPVGSPDAKWLSTFDPDELITITFTGDPVTAVGGNLYLTVETGEPASASLKVTLSDGQEHTFSSGDPRPFIGFTSTIPITSLTIDPLGSGQYATVDNLQVGTAVPEPVTTGLIAGSGLLGYLIVRHRRRQRAAA